MRKTLILMAALIGVVMLVASCGMLSTEVTYNPEDPVVGEPIQFEADLDFDIDSVDEEFICENKKHKKDFGKVYTRDSKHFKKHTKPYKKYAKAYKKGDDKKLDKIENKVEKKLDKSKKTYDWDFGDGSTSTEENPTHIYDAEGTYWVSVAVTVKNPDKKSRKNYEDFTVYGGVDVVVLPGVITPAEPYIGTWEFVDDRNASGGLDGEEMTYNFIFNRSDSFELRMYGWDNTAGEEVLVWAGEGTMEFNGSVFEAEMTEVLFPNWSEVMFLYVNGPTFNLMLLPSSETTMAIVINPFGMESWFKPWSYWTRGTPREFTKMP